MVPRLRQTQRQDLQGRHRRNQALPIRIPPATRPEDHPLPMNDHVALPRPELGSLHLFAGAGGGILVESSTHPNSQANHHYMRNETRQSPYTRSRAPFYEKRDISPRHTGNREFLRNFLGNMLWAKYIVYAAAVAGVGGGPATPSLWALACPWCSCSVLGGCPCPWYAATP